MSLLEVKNLTIQYGEAEPAVKDVSFSLDEGEILSIVGESGSGKTTVIRGILGLISGNGRITEGSIVFNGKDLRQLKRLEMRMMRGRDIAMIFQDAGLAMDPVFTIGKQFVEYIQAHRKMAGDKVLAVRELEKSSEGVISIAKKLEKLPTADNFNPMTYILSFLGDQSMGKTADKLLDDVISLAR